MASDKRSYCVYCWGEASGFLSLASVLYSLFFHVHACVCTFSVYIHIKTGVFLLDGKSKPRMWWDDFSPV